MPSNSFLVLANVTTYGMLETDVQNECFLRTSICLALFTPLFDIEERPLFLLRYPSVDVACFGTPIASPLPCSEDRRCPYPVKKLFFLARQSSLCLDRAGQGLLFGECSCFVPVSKLPTIEM